MANTNIKENAGYANQLHEELIKGVKFGFPEIDLTKPPFNWKPDPDGPLYKEPNPLTNEDLTERRFSGGGTFDALMESVYNHLDVEYEKGRFSKDDYVKAYISLTEASMTNGVQFLIQRDQAYWQAVAAQMQARMAVIQMEIAKMQLASQRYSALLEEAKYANSKMQTLNQEVAYDSAEYSLDKLLPAQHVLLIEQGESQRAQTLDNRSDGQVVKGSVGKQKDLYTQQIEAYKRDAEYKVGKFYADAFITMKTIDEGLIPPSNFTNANVDRVLDDLKRKNNMVS